MGGRQKLAVLALFSIALLASLIFLFSQDKAQEKQTAPKGFFASSSGCRIGNAESRHSLNCLASVSSPGNFSHSLYLFQEEPKRAVYLLEYPRIGAPGYESFKSELSNGLLGSGIFFSQIGMEEAKKLRDSVLIVPSGVFPKPLYDSLADFSASRNAIVYTGMQMDYLLEEDGSIISNPSHSSWVALPKTSPGWSGYRLNNSYIYSTERQLGKFQSPHAAAEEISQIAFSQPWLFPKEASGASGPISGAFEMQLFSGSASGYPRAVLSQGGKTLLLDFGKTAKPPGNLLHRPSTANSSGLEIQAAVNRTFSSSVFLSFSLEVQEKGRKALSIPAGNASVKEVWFSSLVLGKSLPPGDYTLLLKDQYGQVHAGSYLHVKNISVLPAPSEGPENSYLVLEDGHPLGDSFIEAGASRQGLARLPAIGGFVRLPRDDGQAADGHYFLIDGLLLNSRAQEKEDIFAFYSKYALPAFALVAFVFLLFRRGSGRLSIILPDGKKPRFRQVKMKKEEVISCIRNASSSFPSSSIGITIPDIRRSLEAHARKAGHDAIFSDENVLEAVAPLIDSGELSSFGDYYSFSKTDPRKAGIIRMAYEKLLPLGKNFKVKKEGIFLPGCMIIPHSPDSIPPLPKKGRLFLAFPDRDELSSFQDSLASPDRKKIRLLLAIKTGKALLCTPDEIPGLI